MNRSFRAPIVDAEAGGKRGGGTQLTALGSDVVRLYRTVEKKAAKAAVSELAAITRLLAD
jgi:molybdate transport system regulatory protein